jgi:hypothetical protein
MNKNNLPVITPVIIFLVGLGFLGFTYYKNLSNKPAALSVTSKYKEAEVELRGKALGSTPFETTDVKPGTAELILKTDTGQQKKQITLTEQALTVVSGDVGVSDNFSASLIIWYDKTNVKDGELFVASNPGGAKIKINNKEVGETPTTIKKSDILDNSGDEYNIVIEKEGYETQKVTIKLEDGYTLNLSSDLFLKPIPKSVQKPESNDLYTLYSFTEDALASNGATDWAKATAYWLDTRGTALFGSDNVNYFDYFTDSGGNLYDGKGGSLNKDQINLDKEPAEPLIISYLNTENTEGVSDEAKATVAGLFGKEATEILTNQYTVKETGVGYLNVRKTADLNGELLGQLNIGDTVTVVSLEGDWYKIEYKDGENGQAFVYATHLQKAEPKAAEADTETKEETTEDPTPTPTE